MTIQVTSTTERAETPVEVAGQSAPVAEEAAEPKESTESGTEETEKKESEGDESESDEGEDESLEAKDETEKDKPKKKSGSQRRKERAERAEAEVARLQRLVEEMALKGAGDSKKLDKAEPKASQDGKPNPDDYEKHSDYVEAVTDWKVEQKLKDRDQNLEKSKLQTEREQLIKSHVERVESFKKKTADYDDVVEAVDHIPVSATVQELVVSSENGPELIYELAKNPGELERIAKLPPLAAAREIGRIESRLSQGSEEKKPEPKKLTKAPKPIDPVGGSKGVVQKRPEDMTQSEYERWRSEQKKRKGA